MPEPEPLTLFRAEAYPAYTVRESNRARIVRLHITPSEGLVVVVPRGYDRRRIPAIISGKIDWIEKNRAWAERERRLAGDRKPPAVPETIELLALGETWSFTRVRDGSSRSTMRVRLAEFGLTLSGPDVGREACLAALNRWTGRKARESLAPWLADLAADTGLGYGKVRIGNQRSLWASCSPSGTISLNQKLLFVPRRLVRYVLIHELCHTVHMNHSRRFWARVRRHEPACNELRRELGESWTRLPGWLVD